MVFVAGTWHTICMAAQQQQQQHGLNQACQHKQQRTMKSLWRLLNTVQHAHTQSTGYMATMPEHQRALTVCDGVLSSQPSSTKPRCARAGLHAGGTTASSGEVHGIRRLRKLRSRLYPC